jgi:hypothetical protein
MEFKDLDRDVQKRVVRLLDIDSRRAMNVYCKLKVPTELAASISICFKQSELDDFGHTEFYIFHVTPKYKIERYVDKLSKKAGERCMQLTHTGFGDLSAWEYIYQ